MLSHHMQPYVGFFFATRGPTPNTCPLCSLGHKVIDSLDTGRVIALYLSEKCGSSQLQHLRITFSDEKVGEMVRPSQVAYMGGTWHVSVKSLELKPNGGRAFLLLAWMHDLCSLPKLV